MKRPLLSNLLISLTGGVLAFGLADAASMVPITACTDCHGTNPQTNVSPVEGTERNNPARSVIGSHAYHVNSKALTCASCHTVPTTLNHRDGKIQMASPMAGGVTYSVAVGGAVTQNNQLTTTGMGTCSGTSCHSSSPSPVWGSASTCQTCHGYPPVTTVGDPDNKHAGTTPVNHIGTGSTVNTKTTFVSQHGGCQICHGTQSTTDGTGNTHDPFTGYDVNTLHASGKITMNGPVGTGTGYDPTTRGCNAACHANDATHRLTASGLTVDYFSGPTPSDCLTCHQTIQSAPIAQSLNATVTSRVAVTPDFSLASKHIRSRGTAVTSKDCCVCHMEGDVATGSPTSYHKNGYIELRALIPA